MIVGSSVSVMDLMAEGQRALNQMAETMSRNDIVRYVVERTNFITEALERRGNVAIGTDPHGLTSGLAAPLVDTAGDQERIIADAFNVEFNARLTYREIQQMWLVNIASMLILGVIKSDESNGFASVDDVTGDKAFA